MSSSTPHSRNTFGKELIAIHNSMYFGVMYAAVFYVTLNAHVALLCHFAVLHLGICCSFAYTYMFTKMW